jgi:hypothetical protein
MPNIPLKFLALELLILVAFFPNFFIGSLPSLVSHLLHRRADTTVTAIPPDVSSTEMSWFQKQFTLPARSRGSYLVTDAVVSELPQIREYKTGLLNLFIQHTSCALSLNENWDEDVREDMSDALDRIAPADRKGNLYRHSAEGEDDMPVRGEPQKDPLKMGGSFLLIQEGLRHISSPRSSGQV